MKLYILDAEHVFIPETNHFTPERNIGVPITITLSMFLINHPKGLVVLDTDFNVDNFPEVNVNTIIPCYVETEGLRNVARDIGLTPEAYMERIGKTVLLGQVESVDEIGDRAVFLPSRELKYITGQEIVIDGGNLIQTKKGDF